MKSQRTRGITIVSLLLLGLICLFLPSGTGLNRLLHGLTDILHGAALAFLMIGALMLLKRSRRASLVLGIYALLAGIVLLWWPEDTLLRGASTALLLTGTLLFAATCRWQRVVGNAGLALMLISFVALYGVAGGGLQQRALVLLLTGTLAFSQTYRQLQWVEWSALGLIAAGLIFLCQPFWLPLYQTGFQVLLAGTTAFIVVSHRT